VSVEDPGQLIVLIEIHIGCWKQFNYFVNAARAKMFGPDEEFHFLELKKIMAKDLEVIFASIEARSPARTEIPALMGRAQSLRHLSEMGEGDLHDIENAWHKIYISWHSILGQLKMKQRNGEISSTGGKK
jgi:hypothetical protein